MSATVAQSAPARKTERRLTLVRPFDADGKNAVLRITMTTPRKTMPDKVEEYEYFLDQVPADFGRAFYLEERAYAADPADDDKYHVNIDVATISGRHPAGVQTTCECKGFLRWGLGKDGTGCKHVGACVKLIQLGKV